MAQTEWIGIAVKDSDNECTWERIGADNLDLTEHDANVEERAYEKLLERLRNIDNCGFAMFSLELIEETIEDLKGEVE